MFIVTDQGTVVIEGFAPSGAVGLLVDDAIVVVENIVRHLRLPTSERKPIAQVAIEAVSEVGNPTILATWAVIASTISRKRGSPWTKGKRLSTSTTCRALYQT
mgnify:CR=1 FL=1